MNDCRRPGSASRTDKVVLDDIVAFAGRQSESDWTTGDPLTATLVASQPGSSTPAWDRLNRLCEERTSRA
jgi:hypothetical protein